jgi:hypothetical protein
MWRREGRRKRLEKGFWVNQSEVREESFDEEAWNRKMKRCEDWVKRHEKIFGESQWETRRGEPWRERQRWRGVGGGGEAHPLFLPEGTHPLFLPGVVHLLFLPGVAHLLFHS